MTSIIIDSISYVPLVYVLELEDACWYVGYSSTLNKRLADHFKGQGAKWTKLHKPVRLHEVVVGNKEKENEKTQELIQIYGQDKVRGGCWCRVDLLNVSDANQDEAIAMLRECYEEVCEIKRLLGYIPADIRAVIEQLHELIQPTSSDF